MIITEVESIVLLGRLHFVKVHTDEGLVGLGEISPMNAAVTHTMITSALGPLLVGEEATDVERLWRRMYTKPFKLGPSGAQLNAIAGIDIALWDLLGKATGQPVYRLLGGKYRQGTKVYASSMSRSMTPAEEAERALSYQEKGFHGYKIHSATPWMHDDGFDQTIATVTAVRELVGDDFPIMVDVNNAYYSHTVLKIARALEELGVWHFEEPLAAHDYEAYGRLADAVDIPIAVGEQEYSSWQFRDLITVGRVDILQPDVIKCGGITELKKIAVLADTYTKPITVHNTQQTVGTAAHAHVWVSTPACVYPQEYNIEHNPILDDTPIWTNPLLPVDGVITPHELPGLGVELDDDVVARLRTA
ncbi:mandelate racemase/muconate lactonizing enzyme family protein [Microlunatus parietis]|uniref:D-arabinonate dehydratase/D-galactarolactone cycloisomerase n=1 Tax=Microlunatus parietis TaxID=682979 RepID=A0A7Y9LEC2_9ACTN|nr:mandelate racemase/muconate lactonizing enzyme family protein [Microlunatus parietis]NYE73740.1 D-arabinonate dehydratase/D-galactarolactone cycloisomerase [Microlunatus parietis]